MRRGWSLAFALCSAAPARALACPQCTLSEDPVGPRLALALAALAAVLACAAWSLFAERER